MTKSNDSQRAAVALAYRETDAAPRVVAKGKGLLADEIIARAKEHDVFVHESPELLGLLMQVNLDDRIPPQLYLAVAELLAWLYAIEHDSSAAAGQKTLPPLKLPIPQDASETHNPSKNE